MSSEESQGQVTKSPTIEDTIEQLNEELRIAEAEANIGELFESFGIEEEEEDEGEQAEHRSQPLGEETVLEKPYTNSGVLDDESDVPAVPISRAKTQKPTTTQVSDESVPADQQLCDGKDCEKHLK